MQTQMFYAEGFTAARSIIDILSPSPESTCFLASGIHINSRNSRDTAVRIRLFLKGPSAHSCLLCHIWLKLLFTAGNVPVLLTGHLFLVAKTCISRFILNLLLPEKAGQSNLHDGPY